MLWAGDTAATLNGPYFLHGPVKNHHIWSNAGDVAHTRAEIHRNAELPGTAA